ncbi:MAG: phosphate ABC transporter permease PstA, partial [Paracoccaceae bacterium]
MSITQENAPQNPRSLMVQDARIAKRHRSERRFRMLGRGAIILGLLALAMLLTTILSNGLSAFRQTYIQLEVTLPADRLDPTGTRDRAEMARVTSFGYAPLLAEAMRDAMAEYGINIDGLSEKQAGDIVSRDAPNQLRNFVLDNPQVLGQRVAFEFLASSRVDGYMKGRVTMESAERDSQIAPEQLMLVDALIAQGVVEKRLNWAFLTNPDASEQRPEAAGMGVAIIGSAYMMLVVLVLALPLGVATSIYLEEFAPKNRWTDLIEVNISNLAAVPSIVFGILGLSIFINFAGLPQSAPIVGGLVLTLMTLPTIIIATRAALRAVPPSIRDAALGLGASRLQSVFHHVLPLAAPGILTGTIIGLAQALGETAPLMLIGMVAFVREFPDAPPAGLFDPASALPVQIYNWTQRA